MSEVFLMLKGDPSWGEESRMKGTEEGESAVLHGGAWGAV